MQPLPPLLLLLLLLLPPSSPLLPPVPRRSFLSLPLLLPLPVAASPLSPSQAAPALSPALSPKRPNLSPQALADVVRADVAERKFLATGELTRAVYSESCVFVDEIDTYTLDKWIAGTGRLFDGAASSVSLVGDAVASSPTQLSFRFDETLQFNIPFKPRSHLTGTVTLTRDPGDGLITEYRESWDQSVADTLRNLQWGN
ncbi:hypothetical protein TeGR_g2465 [Tetraparma gracilis]|uniref:Uncharacterized protein n=1 Tax=Tetraparma gracilis TaxID=2962635 RepID=A0ABQ6MM76_9STRA|nr:hypothetical protein TeGR_g2465 [Tetraparma gracilis]